MYYTSMARVHRVVLTKFTACPLIVYLLPLLRPATNDPDGIFTGRLPQALLLLLVA
jgi:hypothetical protein